MVKIKLLSKIRNLFLIFNILETSNVNETRVDCRKKYVQIQFNFVQIP